jgi:EAL domain-containing protein (putative c-di-GMP-specific phosphodiesterase class I)
MDVITSINKTLDKNNFTLEIEQIIDTLSESIYKYLFTLTLDAYKIKYAYILNICKKRNKLDFFEKYLIKEVFIYLNKLNKELEIQVEAMVMVSILTISSADFKEYISDLINRYNIENSVLSFIIYDDVKTNLNKQSILKLKNIGIKLYTYSINDLLEFDLDGVFYKYQDNLEKVSDFKKILDNKNIDFILDDIDTKTKLKNAKDNAFYKVKGSIFKNISASSLIDKFSEEISGKNNEGEVKNE